MLVSRYTTNPSVRGDGLQYTRDLDARLLARIVALATLPPAIVFGLLEAGCAVHTSGGYFVLADAGERARRAA